MNKVAFISMVFLICQIALSGTTEDTDLSRAFEEGLYRNATTIHGIPLGGIGCGSVDLGTDGWFDRLTINNNWRGFIPKPSACFFAVRIEDREKSISKILRRGDTEMDDIENIAYTGVFPFADLTFSDSELPIEVHLQAWSPLCAWNLKDSTLPGAFFVFQYRNKTGRPLKISLAFAWENLLGLGVDLQSGIPWEDRIGNYQQPRSAQSTSGLVFGTTKTLEPNNPRRSTLGTYAIAAEQQQNHTVTFLPSWNAQTLDTFMALFSKNGRFFDETEPGPWPVGSEDVHTAGAIADQVELPAGESAQTVFVLTWHCPVVVGPDGREHHQLPAIYFNDAWDAAVYLLKHRERLRMETNQWREPLLSSSLPSWLKIRLLNDLPPLFSRSVIIDNRFAFIEDPFLGMLQSTFAASMTDQFLMRMLPDLSVGNMQFVLDSQREDGEIPAGPGSIAEIVCDATAAQNLDRDARAACGFILRYSLYDHYMGQDELRAEMLPAIRKAVSRLIGFDADGNGIPESGGSALDPEGRRNYADVAGMWLAALAVTEEFQSLDRNIEFLGEIQATAHKAEESMLVSLWNGRYFKAFFDPRSPLDAQASLLPPEQLIGEWFAHLLGRRNLLPAEHVKTSLGTILDLLTSKDDAFRSDVLAEPDNRILTALAALAVYEERASEGLQILEAMNRRAISAGYGMSLPVRFQSSTDTNEALAGPVSWSMLTALEGLFYDARLQRLILSPHLPAHWEEIHAPVYCPTFQGWVDYQAASLEAARRITFRLDRTADGRALELAQVGTEVPPSFRNQNPLLFLEGQPHDAGIQQTSLDNLVYVLQKPMKIRPGNTYTMILATENTGRIDIDLENHKAMPKGPFCAIDSLSDSKIGFSISNRLPRSQIINLHFTNLPKEPAYRVALNGQDKKAIAAEDSVLTFTLSGGSFTQSQEERGSWVPNRIMEMIQILSLYPKEIDALKEVWNLDKTAQEFASAMVGGRTAWVDIVETGQKIPKRTVEETISPEKAEKLTVNLEKALLEFRKRIVQEVLDPSLNAKLIGLTLPLTVQLEPQGDPGKDLSFGVVATVRNPQRLSFTGRLLLTCPRDDWKIEAQDPVELNASGTGIALATRRFLVRMPNPALDGRVEITGRLLGDLEGQPFAVDGSMVVGHGYLRDWMVLGSFPNPEDKGLTDELPAETKIDLNARYNGVNGEIQWQPHYSGAGYVDLASFFSAKDPALAYAHVYVQSPNDRPAVLHLGASEGIRILLNYQEVFMRNGLRTAVPGQHVVPVRLQSGWNSLLLKISHLRGDWGFYLEITDPTGKPIPELKVALKR
ncbi:MAG TPA: GH116 family glycosyl-hydrolase [bacterium]|nr:GH116 family glycosyl-hydrolase [bacterium]